MKVLQRLGIVFLRSDTTQLTPSRRAGATMIPEDTSLGLQAYSKFVIESPADNKPRVECYRAVDDNPPKDSYPPPADRGVERVAPPFTPLHFRLPALNLTMTPEVVPLALDERALRYIKAIESKAGRVSPHEMGQLLVSLRDSSKQLKNNWFINQLALAHYFIGRSNLTFAQDLLELVVEKIGALKNSEDRTAFAAIAKHYQAQCEADL